MLLHFLHDAKGGGVGESIARAIPVDHDAIDAAADHVTDLAMNLCRILRVVADSHVAWVAKPGHQVRIDLGIGA
ncbi:MAG: hypothetical protein DMG89_22585 [Acidobacteria bacterium]|nr:MAG: hypothetical protein DMG89_22585 [Acidobacteriota bacterium]